MIKLKAAKREMKNNFEVLIIVFIDLKEVIITIQQFFLCINNFFLKNIIDEKTFDFKNFEYLVVIRWISSYIR